MQVTYGILIQFDENRFLSDFVPFEFDVEDISEIELIDHANVCVLLLNYYCNQYKQTGELIHFSCEDEDLTEQVKDLLVRHK